MECPYCKTELKETKQEGVFICENKECDSLTFYCCDGKIEYER